MIEERVGCLKCGQARRIYPQPATCLHCGFIEERQESKVFLGPGDKRQVCFEPTNVTEIRYEPPKSGTVHLAGKITSSGIEIKKGNLLQRILKSFDGGAFVEVEYYIRKGINEILWSFR